MRAGLTIVTGCIALAASVATAEAAKMDYRGQWSASTAYVAGDVVRQGNALYRANAASTNVVPSTASRAWRLLGRDGLSWRGAWTATTGYATGAVVSQGGQTYLALKPSLNRPPATQTGFWALLGSTGSTVRSGSGAPPAAEGLAGDFWIDLATQTIYGPRTASGWPLAGTAMTGPAGAQGETGATGAAGPQGAVGLRGAEGEQGAAGPIGPIGAQGASPLGPTGPQGIVGAQGPTGPTAAPQQEQWWSNTSFLQVQPNPNYYFGDLIDPGTGGRVYPLITATIGPSGSALVMMSQLASNGTGSGTCNAAFRVTGPGNYLLPANASRAIFNPRLPEYTTTAGTFLVTGLPSGDLTFELGVAASSGTCNTQAYKLLVIPQ